jgi:small-conductance mechanosensitive channel
MDTLERAAYVLLALVFGFLLVRLFLAAAKHVARRQLPARGVDIVEKTVKYGGAALVVINASRIAGIDLSAVLGAAGVAGIALGFAAQTSVSNVISGIFLFSEKTFTPGDVINLGDVTGTVESVDMLSVKLRTADNRLVRVPNETMIKSNIVNLTHWPSRRMDLSFVVPYGADVAEIERLLLDAARETPAALASPPPFFMPDRLSPDGIAIIFGVWFNQEDFVEVKRRLVPHIADRLARIGLKPAAQTIRLDETGARAG